ncbi:MAG: hemerythrin family protein [Thiohalocapsa sp.]|nr:hemerythrin family protein [Thiohalocapsa sp.]
MDFIDHNHRALAAELNRAAFDLGRCAACADGVHAEARLLEALEAIGVRLRRQCHCEEQLMRAMDYPALEEHRAQHDQLLGEYADMLRQMQRGCRKGLAMQALAALKRWLSRHALREDKALAAFIHQNGGSAAVI